MADQKKLKIIVIPKSLQKEFLEGKLIFDKETYDVSDLVSSLATEVWRLQKRLSKCKDFLPKDNQDINSFIGQMQRVEDIFKKQEIEIRDHTGDEYTGGSSFKVIHIEEIEDLAGPAMRVIETVKPSIYFKGQIILNGEVIVGKSRG
jgi:hypothetical protein